MDVLLWAFLLQPLLQPRRCNPPPPQIRTLLSTMGRLANRPTNERAADAPPEAEPPCRRSVSGSSSAAAAHASGATASFRQRQTSARALMREPWGAAAHGTTASAAEATKLGSSRCVNAPLSKRASALGGAPAGIPGGAAADECLAGGPGGVAAVVEAVAEPGDSALAAAAAKGMQGSSPTIGPAAVAQPGEDGVPATSTAAPAAAHDGADRAASGPAAASSSLLTFPIVTGDFNSTAGSALYQFVVRGHVDLATTSRRKISGTAGLRLGCGRTAAWPCGGGSALRWLPEEPVA